MRVLVTGDRGMIGRVLSAHLHAQGDCVVGFDRVDGYDVLDRAALRAAAAGCDAIVHLAAVDAPPDGPSAPIAAAGSASPEEIMTVNALGTGFVLSVATGAGVRRVVFMSSVDALGIFLGERVPDYLPIDDAHPTHPRSPYALAKRLAQQMCRAFTAETGIATVCLRPPGVFAEETYTWIKDARSADPAFEWSPYWEYGAFLDVHDLASAVSCALRCPDPGHVTLLVCADDISSARLTTRELARRIMPDVLWRGGPEFERDPYRALLDTRNAHRVLGWSPQRRWRVTGRSS